MSAPDANQKTGKFMYVVAWIAALFLLSVWFNEELEEQWNPNQNNFAGGTESSAQLVLQRNRFGHYVTDGLINNKKVVFLLDTGATNVSVPAYKAAELGLTQGSPATVMTANGSITVYKTRIRELRLGNIRLYDVNANLNPAMNNEEILLGMSALKQLEFKQRGDQLILKTYN